VGITETMTTSTMPTALFESTIIISVSTGKYYSRIIRADHMLNFRRLKKLLDFVKYVILNWKLEVAYYQDKPTKPARVFITGIYFIVRLNRADVLCLFRKAAWIWDRNFLRISSCRSWIASRSFFVATFF
jgi:hypothetical protein